MSESIQLSLQELKNMCSNSPKSVTIAKKSALDRAADEFGLMSAEDIKAFIADDLGDATSCPPTASDQLPGTTIIAYKFKSGRKNGYLAFHASLADSSKIHIKSFHLDDTNPSLGTLGDVFKDLKVGGQQ